MATYNKAIEIMMKTGWTPGQGLGRDQQGILEPISSMPDGFAGKIYGGSRAPPRIGLGIPNLPGWNGNSYHNAKAFLFSLAPSRFIREIPKKDTSKFICSDSDEDEIPPPPLFRSFQEFLDRPLPPPPQDNIPPPPPPPPLNTTSSWAQVALGHGKKVVRLLNTPIQSMGERREHISCDFNKGSKKQSQKQRNKGKKNKKSTTQVYYDMP